MAITQVGARRIKLRWHDRHIFLGLDADARLGVKDRRPQSPSQEPNCHLSSEGQTVVANSITKKISELAITVEPKDPSSSP